MTTQPEVVKQSDLLNQLVLDRNTLEELGRVEVLWMYPVKHRVLGFICKSGFLGSKKAAFKLVQLDAIGANGILTHSPPEETNAESVRKLESPIHWEVWGDAGNRIGKVIDYVFNLQTGEIKHYLMVSSGWGAIAGHYQLPPSQILSLGSKRVLVAESVISTLALDQEGIPQKLVTAKEILEEDYEQVRRGMRSLTRQAQMQAERARGQFHDLTEHTKERAQSLSNQAKEKIQTFGEQLREKSQTLAQQAKEQGKILVEQVQERTHQFSEQVEEGIETLTVQAEEIFDLGAEEKSRRSAAPSSNSSTQDNQTGTENQTSSDDDDDEPWI
jgi:uncharacterized protein YrrD